MLNAIYHFDIGEAFSPVCRIWH